ncbi:hypothetical protein MTO96_050143 [Rhipicephalus appendiculatus]
MKKMSGGQVAQMRQQNNGRRGGKEGATFGGNVRVARGWERRGQTKMSFCPGVPEAGVEQDVPVEVPVTVGLSKVQLRWPIQGPRARPGERLLPRCTSRGWVIGRGPAGVVHVGRGLTLVLGSCGPILLGWPRRPSQRRYTR